MGWILERLQRTQGTRNGYDVVSYAVGECHQIYTKLNGSRLPKVQMPILRAKSLRSVS